MKLLNFTPHEITVFSGEEVIERVPSIGVARASEVCAESEAINGIPTVAKRYDAVVGLPETKEDVVYIVSLPVLQASDRDDLVCPDTGPDSVVRDKDGKIIGVRRFQRREQTYKTEEKLRKEIVAIERTLRSIADYDRGGWADVYGLCERMKRL